MENLKIKKLMNDAILPTRGTDQSAGLDLYAYIPQGEITIAPHTTTLVSTGISIKLPNNTFGGVYPRSGLATKLGISLANCVGVVDADYRGDIMMSLHNLSNEDVKIVNGERVAQLIVQPYYHVLIEEVNELDKTERGENGFGSTGV